MSNEECTAEILMVDDDVTALDLVEYLFERDGFSCTRAANGESALELLEGDYKPAVLLVDLMMPGINGIETIEKIRGMGFTSEPIIAFTAADDTDLHEQALSVGATKVLTKPCPPKELVSIVRELLGTC